MFLFEIAEMVLDLSLQHNGLLCYQKKIKLKFFKGSEYINEKWDGPYRGFGYLSFVIGPLDLATLSQGE